MNGTQKSIKSVVESLRRIFSSPIRKELFDSENSAYKKFIEAKSPTQADLKKFLQEIVSVSDGTLKIKNKSLTSTEKQALESIKTAISTEIIGELDLHDNNLDTVAEFVGSDDISNILGKAASLTKILGNERLPGSSISSLLVSLSDAIGDISQLNTDSKDSVVVSVNEVLTKIGTAENILLQKFTDLVGDKPLTKLDTDSKDSLVDGINEILSLSNSNKASLSSIQADIKDYKGDIKSLDKKIGNSDLQDLETKSKASLVKAINSLRDEAKSDISKNAESIVSNAKELEAVNDKVGSKGKGQLETEVNSSLVDAINFLNAEYVTNSGKISEVKEVANAAKTLADTNKASIQAMLETGVGGSVLDQLDTEDQDSLVAAINEIHKDTDSVRAIALAAQASSSAANSKADSNSAAIKTVSDNVGDVALSFLQTPIKSSLVSGINQVYETASSANSKASTNTANIGDTAYDVVGSTITESLVNLKKSIVIEGISSGVFYPCFSQDMAESGNHDGNTIITLKDPTDVREITLKQAQCDKWANSEQDIGYAESLGGECFLVISIGDAAAKCRGEVIVADDYDQ